jgi:peptidoglycan biosynthesis protein MviN/MurJ (putative lipid II flippase)
MALGGIGANSMKGGDLLDLVLIISGLPLVHLVFSTEDLPAECRLTSFGAKHFDLICPYLIYICISSYIYALLHLFRRFSLGLMGDDKSVSHKKYS